ncbi:MAG: hypothetical protein AB7I41_18650 [Candidatus Sericytochromatia bacterium]
MSKNSGFRAIRIDKGYRPVTGTHKPPTTNLPKVTTSGIQEPPSKAQSSEPVPAPASSDK